MVNLLLSVNFPDFFQYVARILQYPTVGHKKLSFRIRYDHEREGRDAEGVIDIALLVGYDRKGYRKLLLVRFDLLFVVSHGKSKKLYFIP